MNIRRTLIALLLIAAAGVSSGCRKGITLHKHRLSMFLVPMYKQPLGYSSTYARHLRQAEGAVEHAGFETVSSESESATVLSDQAEQQSRNDSDDVIFLEPDGKECKLPTSNRTR